MAGPFRVESIPQDPQALAAAALREERLHALMVWGPILAVLIAAVVLTWLARKRWPVITILLYTLWVVVLFTPLVLFVGFWLGNADGWLLDEIWDFLFELYGGFWPFWIFCGIVVISQALLLIIPVRIVKQRPKPQRGLWATAIAAGALFAIVALGIVWSVVAAVAGDYAIEGIVFLCALIFLLLNWLVWSCLFRAFARNADPRSYVRRLTKWLLRGTILELLVAVPSHVIVRHRDVCCAHGITAAGIATGITIMLVSFGPGVYFLYAERIKSKKPNIS